MDWQSANEQLQGRCRERRKLANNTYLERRDSNAITVRLHSTDVLTFYKDGSLQVETGGWHTVITVDRINRYLSRSWRVGRHRGLTILYRMKPTAWIPVCTVDNSATISPRGKAAGGNVQEYFDRLRVEDNDRNRVRSRARYWIRKARDGKPAKGLTVQSIMAEENITVRVAKMKVFGLERFFLEANPKMLDERVGYQLLEFPLDNWNRMRALKMVCPSTQAVYVSPVEPQCSTVPDALDWMFDTKDYLGQLVQEA